MRIRPTCIRRRRRLSLLVKIEGDPLNTQHAQRRRRRLSLLVKIEEDPPNTQHAQHRPVQATDR